MPKTQLSPRRVVIVYWKNNKEMPFEVFSNLKIFCAENPKYNYNTLNNYLSKDKTAFENADVRIERKVIKNKAEQKTENRELFRLVPVVSKGKIKNMEEQENDLAYWLSRPVQERAAAVTFLISQSLKKGQRMDRTYFVKKKMHK